ncbi:MAG: sodium:solute symporter family protein [Clostridia bacterium]|nr:sodium:solute symporter family protein [Clostridia bacterium]
MSVYLIVFVLYFLVIIATSVMGAKKVESMEDFAVGGNKMGLILGVGTSMATWLSVASVMGVPGNVYSRGICAVTGWFAGWFLSTALHIGISYKVRRPAIPTRTFPEFVQGRYDIKSDKSAIRIAVAIFELIGYFVFSFIQVQGFGIVLNTITGLNYTLCCCLFMVILVFTCMGGFQSVARTDTANAGVILIGVIAGAVTVISVAGGWGAAVQNFATTTAPTMEGGDPIPAGILATNWGTFGASAIISTFLSNSLGAAVAPHWIARFMAPKNAKTGALQFLIEIFLLLPVFLCLFIIGVGGKAILPSLPAGVTTDYMFPQLIVHYLNPVLGAVALTAICAAAVSTANSMLLHCSTSLIYDIVRPLQGKLSMTKEEDNKTTKQLRMWILLIGVFAVIGAIMRLSLLADGFTYIYGAFGSVFFGLTIFGLFWKRMNQPGAWASMLVGFVMYLYCTLKGAPFGIPTFIVSAGLSCIAGIIVSLATKAPDLECYEAYFNDNPSRETLLAIKRLRRDA